MRDERRNGQTEHDRFSELLSAYLDGQVTADERVALDRHLATCAGCRRQLDELNWTVELLRELPAVPVPRSFAVPVTGPTPAGRFWSWLTGDRGFLFLRGATALVTALLVVVFSLDRLGPVPWRGGATLPAPRVIAPQALEAEKFGEVYKEPVTVQVKEVEKIVEVPQGATEEGGVAATPMPGGEAADQTQAVRAASPRPAAPMPTAAPALAVPTAATAVKSLDTAQPAEAPAAATGQAEGEFITGTPTPEARIQRAAPPEVPAVATLPLVTPSAPPLAAEVAAAPPTAAFSPAPQEVESRPTPVAAPPTTVFLPAPQEMESRPTSVAAPSAASPVRLAEFLLAVSAAGLVGLTLVVWRQRAGR
jgi:hypothetical protein